jgi:hypothetical protein
MKVGDKILLVPTRNHHGGGTVEREVTISKVGKKYFEVEGMPRSRFFIDTLQHDGREYTSLYRGYLTQQEILDEREAAKLSKELSEYFPNYGKAKLDINILRQIKELIL